MDIYFDYANWKFENYDFIFQLIKEKSNTISRFSSIIAVVDYLYEQYLKKGSLSVDEEVFFSNGFDYIHDNFFVIKTIFDHICNKDYKELNRLSKTINLLLYVQEFKNELSNTLINPNELIQLKKFEETIQKFLDKKQNAPDVYFPMLDDIVNPIFITNNIEFVSIESIFYEVALEYGIYKNDDVAIFNDFINLKIKKYK